VYVQGGLREPHLRLAYDRAMDGMAAKLLQSSSPSQLAYVADWEVNGCAGGESARREGPSPAWPV